MGTERRTSLASAARRLSGTAAIGLAAGVFGIGPPASPRLAPAVRGIARSIAASPAPAPAPAPGHAFRASDTGFSVNDTSGNALADDAQFAVGSLALSDAETIAIHHWGAMPCNGQVKVSWETLDPTINGVASWWNPVAAYGNAQANASCSISMNLAQDYSWPMLCTVVTHEIGHLLGHDHLTDPRDVMYPVYDGPISECLAPPIGVPVPAGMSSTAARHSVSASALSRKAKAAKHKKHKKRVAK